MLKFALSPYFSMAWPKIELAVLGNAFEAFEIMKEKPELSHMESHEAMSRADIEEIEEQVRRTRTSMIGLPICTWV